MTFFVSWELWVQMTFVLGAALFLTIAFAVVQLFFQSRALRKKDHIATRERDTELQAQIEQLRDDLRHGRWGAKEVPEHLRFGVQQLEYLGAVHAGVVNMSRTNSAATSLMTTPEGSVLNLPTGHKRSESPGRVGSFVGSHLSSAHAAPSNAATRVGSTISVNQSEPDAFSDNYHGRNLSFSCEPFLRSGGNIVGDHGQPSQPQPCPPRRPRLLLLRPCRPLIVR